MDNDVLARFISMSNTIVTSQQAFITEEALTKFTSFLQWSTNGVTA